MTRLAIVALALMLMSATAAEAGTFRSSPGTFRSSPGTFGSSARSNTMTPPKPPAPPASPGYRPASQEGGFKPWKPTMRTDSTRGGVNAYPSPKKPRGYISPY